MIQPYLSACDCRIPASSVTLLIRFKESFGKMHPIAFVLRLQNVQDPARSHLLPSKVLLSTLKTDDERKAIGPMFSRLNQANSCLHLLLPENEQLVTSLSIFLLLFSLAGGSGGSLSALSSRSLGS